MTDLDLAPAAADPAAQGLRLDLSVESTRIGGEPRITADMDYARYPGDGAEGFTPVRIPEQLRFRLADVDARLVHSARARFTVRLRAGAHPIPLAGGSPLRVQLAPGAVIHGSLDVGTAMSGDGAVVVRAVDLDFFPAASLENVLEALVEVQHLFADRRLAALLGGQSLGGLLDRARAGLGLDRLLGARAQGPLLVRLARVTARPRFRRSRWELELAFSGHVQVGTRLAVPFRDVVLPAAVLPVFHAALDRLASATPLASGDLHADRVDPRAVLQAARAMVESVAGDLGGVVDPPVLALAGAMIDRTRFDAALRLPHRLSLEAAFQLELDGEDARLTLPAVTLGFADHPDASLGLQARAAVHLDLDTPDLPAGRRVAVAADVSLAEAAVLPLVEVEFDGSHPLAEGGAALRLSLTDVKLAGAFGVRVGGGVFDLEPAPGGLEVGCFFEAPDQVWIRRARATFSGACTGEASATLTGSAAGWDVRVEGSARVVQQTEALVAPIPELRIEDNRVRARVEATVTVDARAALGRPGAESRELTVSPAGSVGVTLERVAAELDGRRLELPAGTSLTGRWREGAVSSASPGSFAIDLGWDLHGEPCLLHGALRSVSLLAPALRQGELTMHISPGGRFSFSGQREGLYGVRYFNALLDPGKEATHLLELFESDEALGHVSAALEVFNPELAELLTTVRRFALRMRDHLKQEEITQPADAIPRPRLARILSLAIGGSGALEARLEPLIKSVTEGRGLDLNAAKDILREHLGGRRLDYEVDGVLRWLDLVTGPSERLPRAADGVADEPPLVEDPRFTGEIADLPSAAEIYRVIDAGGAPVEFVTRVAALSPYLTLAQIGHVLRRAEAHWPDAVLKRLRHVREAKRRVARIEEGYGGLAFAAQSANIAGFLGEAVGPLPIDGQRTPDSWPPPCALGPKDVAQLLVAGLSEGHQGLQTQINNRLLLDLCRVRPGEFLREVLVEAGQQVPRVLVGVLFAFLAQDQDELRESIDLAALLEEKLGLKVPRQADFMAGGRRVRDSYYEALAVLADQIFDQAGAYLCRRAHLREVVHPVPRATRAVGRAADLARDAQAAIRAADKLGRRLKFDGRPGALHRAARAAYRDAFAAGAAVLAELPTGFQLPWFKRFWLRNEEALKVLSVVRGHEEDLDDVRRWLAIASRGKVPAAWSTLAARPGSRDEQALLETVVRTLYHFPADQEALLRDPLCRLLIDADPGHYDFTIVSAMGVVTDGAAGRELEDAYRRVGERRGVRVIRAHTGLFRSLEYNAAAIIRAAHGAPGPWGYIGYSQGCPNGLLAESFLYCGTPEQQQLADRLVARNLLFSAANGSVHGTSGSLKFLRAMIEGESFLKHYQARYSRELVETGLRLVRAFMDSAPFVNTLGGAHSLSLERARQLHRDRQCRPDLPTSTTRGVITFERIPEALEYLYCVHERLLPGAPCDSQVPAEEAFGHATRIRNAWTAALERCEMGSLVQSTHHWSPLTAEIEFITTPRDRERAVYQSPKDRHVFPWLDVNARFGRIRRFRPRLAAGSSPFATHAVRPSPAAAPNPAASATAPARARRR
jgi:hypothetical protein